MKKESTYLVWLYKIVLYSKVCGQCSLTSLVDQVIDMQATINMVREGRSAKVPA